MGAQSETFDSGLHTRNNPLLQGMLILVGCVWIMMAIMDSWRQPFGWDHPLIKFLFGILLFVICVVYRKIKRTSRFRRHIIIEKLGLRLKLHPLKSETWIPWERIVAIDCRTPEPRLRLVDHPKFIALGENFAFEKRKALRERLKQIVPEKCIST